VSRPTIALCMIIKNEIKNLPRLLESVSGCMDEIHITDTGSTDGSIEWLKENGEKIAQCPIFVHHFEWVNSFCKARNYSFSHAKTDYLFWMDGDDVLANKEGFIQWRDHAMEFGEFFFSTYHYALDQDGKPIVSFVRERVFKRSINPTWQYDLHEGVVAQPGWRAEYAVSWAINHLRSADDIHADKSRNIRILDEIKASGQLDARLKFYYGKELYESGRPSEAVVAFDEALRESTLEPHDKLLSLQYGAYSAIQCADQLKDEYAQQKSQYLTKALDYLHDGIKANPNRAEFHCSVGDIYLKLGQLQNSIPYYSAAKKCWNPRDSKSPYEGAIYSFVDCYGRNPTVQLAKVYFNLGRMKEARREALEAAKLYKDQESLDILKEINRIASLVRLDNNQTEVEDIVFTCPPQSAYEFDEELYKTKGMGGSETALIEVAKQLRQLTQRRVIVFNMRSQDLVAESGVEYISNAKLTEYFSKNRPAVHIAWRHNTKLTNAKTYLWCHDLVTPSVESHQNFDKILCLTPFHKNYVMAKQNVSSDKIIVTRNGITPEKFNFKRKVKNQNKLVWMSSPDRGLDRAMIVCDEVRKTHPDIELHVYYGLENLYKYGLGAMADHLKAMMAERPYVRYHGFTEQKKMYEDVSDAVVWIHPCNFIETFCITALEMLALNIYPVTRKLGALQDTLRQAELLGWATMLDNDCITIDQQEGYIKAVREALNQKKWESISFNSKDFSWKSIAKEWIDFMSIQISEKKEVLPASAQGLVLKEAQLA
jgi:glycosyltransferase involved in cell wall biosynthesis